MGSDIEIVRFLLGSPPMLMASTISEPTTAYRDAPVLRASAAFIKAVAGSLKSWSIMKDKRYGWKVGSSINH